MNISNIYSIYFLKACEMVAKLKKIEFLTVSKIQYNTICL
jgi:hypothetical protein